MSEIRFNRWSHQSGTGGIYQDSSGNIGIGTSTPTSVLDIQGGSIKIGNDLLTSSGVSTFTSGLNVTGGSVGIGTDSPVSVLHVSGTTHVLGNGGAPLVWGDTNNLGSLTFDGSAQPVIRSASGKALVFQVNQSTEALRITSSGNVGIGTDNPARVLHTSGNLVRFDNNAGSGIILVDHLNNKNFRLVTNIVNAASFSIEDMGTAVSGSGTARLTIDGSGKVGINTTSPSAKLNVATTSTDDAILMLQANMGTNNNRVLQFKSPATDSSADPFLIQTGNSIQFRIDSKEALKIHSDGNVGIGSTIPQSSLDVAGEVRASGIAITTSYPTISPSLNLNFARSRSLDPRITFDRASTATYVDSNGFVRTANEDEPRFDHDPETGESLGLLIEGTRTNQLGTHNGTYVGNYKQTNQGLNTTGPDGVINTAREFTVNSDGGTGGSTLISANTNLGTNGTTKSWSCFLKVTRSNSIAFQFYDNNNNLTSDVYTLYADGSDPVYQSAGNNGSTRVDKYPNGWYRFRWEGFVGSSNNTSYLQIYSQSHISSDGSNVGYAIWGQSFETGHRCSSPILTTSGSATRVKESVTILGGNFDSFYNDNEWTVDFVYRIRTVETNGSNYRIWDINNDSNDGRLGALYSPNSIMAYYGYENGGTSFSSDDTGYNVVIDQEYHGALAYSPTSTIAFLPGAGTLGSEDTTVALDQPSQFQIGNWYADDRPMYGTIAKLVYYPKRLSNAELLALTSNV